MIGRTISRWLSAVASIAFAGALFAAPLEDARRALAAGEYDKVDGILQRELARQTPSEEALRTSLEAALQSGRFLTANQRLTALLRTTDNRDMNLVLLGARTADLVGHERQALARYLLFAQSANARSAEFEEACAYIFPRGQFPAEFAKFAGLYGAGESLWRDGEGMLRRMLEDGDVVGTLALAGTLSATFVDQPGRVEQVHRILREAADAYTLGQSVEQRYVAPARVMLAGKPAGFGHVDHVFRQAAPAIPVEERLDLLFAFQRLNQRPLPNGMVQLFKGIDEIFDLDKRLGYGREFLKLEGIYREADNPAHYQNFLQFIVGNDQIFNIYGNLLVTNQDLGRMLQAFQAKVGDDPEKLDFLLVAMLARANDDAAKLAVLTANSRYLTRARFRELVAKSEGANLDAQLNGWFQGRGRKLQVDLTTSLMPEFDATNRKDWLIRAASDYLAAYPGTFSADHVNRHFIASELVTIAEKCAAVDTVATAGGKSKPLGAVVEHMQKQWPDNEEVKNLVAKYGNLATGNDPIALLHVAFFSEAAGNGERALELVVSFLESYDGLVPGGAETTASLSDVALLNVAERHFANSWNNGGAMGTVGSVWLPRMALGSGFDAWVRRMREHNRRGELFAIARHAAEQVVAGQAGTRNLDGLFYDLSHANNPDADGVSALETIYLQMGAEHAFRYLLNNTGEWQRHRAAFMAQVEKVAALDDFAPGASYLSSIASHLAQWTGTEVRLSPAAGDAIYARLLTLNAEQGMIDYQAEANVYAAVARSGHVDPAATLLQRYAAEVAKRSPADRVRSWTALFATHTPPLEELGQFNPGHGRHTLLEVFKPACEAMNAYEQANVPVHERIHAMAFELASATALADDGGEKAAAVALLARLHAMLAAGAPFTGHPPNMFRPVLWNVSRLLQAGEWQDAATAGNQLARNLNHLNHWENAFSQWLEPMATEAEALGAFEIGFGYIKIAQDSHEISETVDSKISIVRARIAQNMPGFITVDESDPTYNLQLAAFSLSLGNEMKAWDLTADKLALLPRVWEVLDPGYVAWVVEQMRKQRLLDKALEMAFTVLLKERELEPEMAAAISLTKGDIYRDQQNWQAARIEYEGLRANRRYRQTAAGTRAQYRLVELMILTKDYASAEQHLDRLIVSDDVRVQADGYYLYARMLFDQGEYREAKDYLNMVRARVINHVEAAFLEGELNLILPGGLQHTEVPVGNPRLSTVAIPGRELTLKLQDPNLAVARANSAIPVIVTTSKGGDREELNLLPSATDQNLFTGVIATSLGPVEKGNLKLELLGEDIVSYQIDPEFQQANGLDYPPKLLEVASDARLTASSGRILTEAEEERMALESRMQGSQPTSARDRVSRDGRTVRPGNDIYVQVRDFDRDVSAAPDTLSVRLTTTSGDVIEAFPLTETGPHTGVFLGIVPTDVPLPKAAASDTAENSDPSIAINSAKTGLWNSLADGVKGKWLEVDTMSSHVVGRAELHSPDVEQWRQVVLKGELASGYEVLATYPELARGDGLGLKAEYFSDEELAIEAFSRIDPMVAFRWDLATPRPVDGETLSVRWSGRVTPRYSERYTFFVYADDGVRLWVDGRLLIDEWKASGARELSGRIELKAGEAVAVKLEYYDRNGDGRCVVSWSSESQIKEIVPQSRLHPVGVEIPEIRDGVKIDVALNQNGEDPQRMTRYLESAPTLSFFSPRPVFDLTETPWPTRGWMTASVRGAFHLPEAKMLELKFGQTPSPHNWQTAYLFIDGNRVLGGRINATNIDQTRRVRLAAGVHDFRLLVRDHFERSKVEVHYRQDDGTFAPLPEEWFSATTNPELAMHLRPAASIAAQAGALVATFEEPRRLRKLRWEFVDFTGNAARVSQLVVVGQDGQTIIPQAQDFSTATSNQILEIAPGDRIAIAYEDARRLREDTPILTSQLNSAYHNGEVILANEVITADPRDPSRRIQTYFPARRCRMGDQLTVIVTEFDADVTDERDTLEVTVTSSSGQSVTLQALETNIGPYGGDAYHQHAGTFLAILRIGTQPGRDTIAVKSGDTITASYLDSENTDPGVPVERVYNVVEGGLGVPEFTVYRTAVDQVEDTSIEARARIERLPLAEREKALMLKDVVVARHPDYRNGDDVVVREVGEMPVVDANAPILFEVFHPGMALNAGSVLTVHAVAQSELDASQAAGREATVLEVPAYLDGVEQLAQSKGYPIQLQTRYRRSGEDMLADGVFAGIIRLQYGSPGDPVDDLVVVGESQFVTAEQRERDIDGRSYRVPTLLVSGSDVVVLTVEDENGEVLARQEILPRSDARIEVLEQSYTYQRDAIFLGETVYVRLTDPDQDRTSEQDTVAVRVKSTSGGEIPLSLVETLPHSGVFTGRFKPEFVAGSAPAVDGAAPPPLPEGVLGVDFGDEVSVVFVDDKPLRHDEPLTVETRVSVREGFDARVVSFSKRFNDPEMAVRTRLLMAEALFEMAKQQRKLEQEDASAENIAEGKMILEEAMRDYPTSSMAAHGEFLLANLAEELENYQEAIGRYTQVVRNWPESEYAAKSQFKKALCLEKMGQFEQACEEYVKLTYIYPDNELVADATIRLASYYYQNEAFGIAARIFGNFQTRNASHALAPRALLLAAHCHMKMENFGDAVQSLEVIVEQYTDNRDVRSEAMYWLGDAEYKRGGYVPAYQAFKKLTWDYPESQWAKFARGRLTEEVMVRQAESD